MHHKKFLLLFLSGILIFGTANARIIPLAGNNADQPTAKDLIGRWDITIDQNGTSGPAWLSVKLSGNRTLVGKFVGTSGSARPIAEIHFNKGKFSFSIPPQWEAGKQDLVVEGEVAGKNILGTLVTPEGKKFNWKGVKAPYLERTSEPEWEESITLFNGEDLSGWKAVGGKNQWVVKDGILTNARAGANLITDQKFMDFKLHLQFRYPEGSNSGVYLRGRYEVQIEDSRKHVHPSSILFSGVYGFLTPSKIAALGPGEWQTFDITLVGRMVTIVANGEEVICNQEIPGITGGALDSNEGEAGPIYLQGDHGPIEFRRIVLTPAK